MNIVYTCVCLRRAYLYNSACGWCVYTFQCLNILCIRTHKRVPVSHALIHLPLFCQIYIYRIGLPSTFVRV